MRNFSLRQILENNEILEKLQILCRSKKIDAFDDLSNFDRLRIALSIFYKIRFLDTKLYVQHPFSITKICIRFSHHFICFQKNHLVNKMYCLQFFFFLGTLKTFQHLVMLYRTLLFI